MGTTVQIDLPLSDSGEQVQHVPHVPPPPLAKPRTVLLVEDEPSVRRATARILERSGYSVIAAADPDEAVRCAAQVTLDLVLTDLVMPGGGGRRVAAAVREKQPHVPVLFMTGYSPDGSELAGEVLLKPFRPDELLSALARAQGTDSGAPPPAEPESRPAASR